jgi:predicted RNA-binding Zn ribbon-like protein
VWLPGKEDPDTARLLGGALCLDFANSVDWDDGGRPIKDEALFDPTALARWGRRLGLYDSLPDLSAAELREARGLREAIYHVLAAVADGAEPPVGGLRRLERDHAAAARTGRLTHAPGEHDVWRLEWPDERRRVRYAAAVDAVALLGDPERLARVHRCPGRDCGWLFLDTSGRRRWCSMDTCGSRAKMRALYERRRRVSEP